LGNLRRAVFNLNQAITVDTRFHWRTLLCQNNPTKLRTLFQDSFKMSHSGSKEVHSTTEIPDSQLKIHRSRVRTSAHADNHVAGPRNVQAELHQAKGQEEQAKARWGGVTGQQEQQSNTHKSRNQTKIQPTTKGRG